MNNILHPPSADNQTSKSTGSSALSGRLDVPDMGTLLQMAQDLIGHHRRQTERLQAALTKTFKERYLLRVEIRKLKAELFNANWALMTLVNEPQNGERRRWWQ